MMTYQDVINYLDDTDSEINYRNSEVLEFVKFQQQVNVELQSDLDRAKRTFIEIAEDLQKMREALDKI